MIDFLQVTSEFSFKGRRTSPLQFYFYDVVKHIIVDSFKLFG